MWTFDGKNGTLSIDAGRFSADNGVITLVLSDRTVRSDAISFTAGVGNEFVGVLDSGLAMVLTLKEPGVLACRISNDAPGDVKVRSLSIEFAPGDFNTLLAARQCRHMVHPFNMLHPEVKPVHMPSDWFEVNAPSGLMTVWQDDPSGQALLMGAVPPFGDGLTSFTNVHAELHMEGHFGIRIDSDIQRRLTTGDTCVLSPLVVLAGDDTIELMEQYGQQIARRNPRPLRPRAYGWNSWDYHARAVTQEDMDTAVEVCRREFGDAVDSIVIDDGWQCAWGTWQANWKFPDGIEAFCRRVKQAGYRPGLWTAPLMMDYFTPLYRQHPDWAAGNADGAVYIWPHGTMVQLDISHPGVAEHLSDVYRTLRQQGVEYFKVDFTQEVLVAERFHDDRVSRANLIRRVFEIIRDAVGDDAYILSCGAPYEAVIGLADGYRSAADIHNYFSHIRHNVLSCMGRWWMQGHVGNVDADFAMVRCGETTDDPWLNRRVPVSPRKYQQYWNDGAEMNLDEAQAAVSGDLPYRRRCVLQRCAGQAPEQWSGCAQASGAVGGCPGPAAELV